MTTRTPCLAAAVILALAASAPTAQAAYVVTIEEVGSNVVETGGGTIDVADLRLVTTLTQGSILWPDVAFFASGALDAFQDTYFSADLSGPSAFGPGSLTPADLTGGDSVSLIKIDQRLSVPQGYSGGPLSETSTYLDATFASLGLTPGSYVWSWGAGAHADTFTIDIGASPVPEPSTWAMMLLGLAALGYAALKHKRLPVVTESPRRAAANHKGI